MKHFLISRQQQIFLLILIGFVLYILTMNISYFNHLVSLPSPIFGGDYYYQMGNVYHFMKEGKFMVSSSLHDALPTYLPLYPYLVANVALLFDLSAIDAMIYSSFAFTMLSLLLWFFVFKKIFSNNYIVILMGLFIVGFQNSIIFKYTDFAIAIFLPLFIWSIYDFLYKRSFYSATFLGIIYGLSALVYTIMFIGVTLFLILLLIHEIFIAYRNGDVTAYIRENLQNVVTVLILAIPIAFIYWYEPVFVNHLHMYYNRPKLDFPDFGQAQIQIKYLSDKIASIVFNFSSLKSTLWTILHIIGVFGIFHQRNEVSSFIKRYFFISLLIVFSYFVTEPLLDTNFVPDRLSLFFLNSGLLLLKLFAVYYLMSLLELDNRMKTSLGVVIAGFILFTGHQGFKHKEESRWHKRGTMAMNPVYEDLGKYLRDHSGANDVILTTKELGFALNSVSGAKLVAGRWAQNGSPYTDLSQRDIDLAIIMYGNNDKVRHALLKKYNVTYLFWSDYWIQSEFFFDKKGRAVDTFDPLIAFDTLEHREQLTENGVRFIKRHFWLDPSVRKKDVKQYDILVISPQNYRSFSMPWNKDLNRYLTKVWTYKKKQKTQAVLYKVSQ